MRRQQRHRDAFLYHGVLGRPDIHRPTYAGGVPSDSARVVGSAALSLESHWMQFCSIRIAGSMPCAFWASLRSSTRARSGFPASPLTHPTSLARSSRSRASRRRKQRRLMLSLESKRGLSRGSTRWSRGTRRTCLTSARQACASFTGTISSTILYSILPRTASLESSIGSCVRLGALCVRALSSLEEYTDTHYCRRIVGRSGEPDPAMGNIEVHVQRRFDAVNCVQGQRCRGAHSTRRPRARVLSCHPAAISHPGNGVREELDAVPREPPLSLDFLLACDWRGIHAGQSAVIMQGIAARYARRQASSEKAHLYVQGFPQMGHLAYSTLVEAGVAGAGAKAKLWSLRNTALSWFMVVGSVYILLEGAKEWIMS